MSSSIPGGKQPYVPTPEQALLASERKAKRLAAKLEQSAVCKVKPDYSQLILPRTWVPVASPSATSKSRVKIMTWNMLAQCLVRRELFPGSDCLKVKDREPMLSAEILHYGPDLVCLQEVDRLESLLSRLGNEYKHIYATGRGKLHGCLLLYRPTRFVEVSSKVVYYDEEFLVEQSEAERQPTGSSRRTKNIGLIAAFRLKEDTASGNARGCILATTHLFWHPRFSYERSRQAFILLREVERFRAGLGLQRWPTFIGGDFNSQPSEATYSLMVGDELLDTQKNELETSRVVHVSVDPDISELVQNGGLNVAQSDDETGIEAWEGSSDTPDRTVAQCREPQSLDGIPTVEELQSLFRDHAAWALRSMYDESGALSNTFGERHPLPPGRKGANEAMWTSFTPLWRLTLDYLFIGHGVDCVTGNVGPRVLAVLMSHNTSNLEPGLPRKGVCASDHVALAAEVEW